MLGFDWILMFLQGHLHSSTVIQAMKILILFFKNPTTVTKFRDGQIGGGWLKDTEMILKQQMGSMLGKVEYMRDYTFSFYALAVCVRVDFLYVCL